MAGRKVHFEGIERHQEIRHASRLEDVRSLPRKLADLTNSPEGTFKIFALLVGASVLLCWLPGVPELILLFGAIPLYLGYYRRGAYKRRLWDMPFRVPAWAGADGRRFLDRTTGKPGDGEIYIGREVQHGTRGLGQRQGHDHPWRHDRHHRIRQERGPLRLRPQRPDARLRRDPDRRQGTSQDARFDVPDRPGHGPGRGFPGDELHQGRPGPRHRRRHQDLAHLQPGRGRLGRHEVRAPDPASWPHTGPATAPGRSAPSPSSRV